MKRLLLAPLLLVISGCTGDMVVWDQIYNYGHGEVPYLLFSYLLYKR